MIKPISLVLKFIAVLAAAEVAKQQAKQVKFKRQQAEKVAALDKEFDRLSVRQQALLAERGLAQAARTIGSNAVNEAERTATILHNRLTAFRK